MSQNKNPLFDIPRSKREQMTGFSLFRSLFRQKRQKRTKKSVFFETLREPVRIT